MQLMKNFQENLTVWKMKFQMRQLYRAAFPVLYGVAETVLLLFQLQCEFKTVHVFCLSELIAYITNVIQSGQIALCFVRANNIPQTCRNLTVRKKFTQGSTGVRGRPSPRVHPGAFSGQRRIQDPQEDPLAHCFCVCSEDALLGGILGVSRSVECDFVCTVLSQVFLSVYCTILYSIRAVLLCYIL